MSNSPWATMLARHGVGLPTAKPLWLPWGAALKGSPRVSSMGPEGSIVLEFHFSLIKLSWSVGVGAVSPLCFSLVSALVFSARTI